jgi:hypothetical protein
MINYDPEQPDSLFLSADTLWLYTIAVLPPVADADSVASDGRDSLNVDDKSDTNSIDERDKLGSDLRDRDDSVATDDSRASEQAEVSNSEASSNRREEISNKSNKDASRETLAGNNAPARGEQSKDDGKSRGDVKSNDARSTEAPKRNATRETGSDISEIREKRETETTAEPKDSVALETSGREVQERADATELESDVAVEVEEQDAEVIEVADSIVDSLDSVKVLTEKQLRYRAKLEKRRVRDSIRAVEREIRDSLDSLKQREKDSIQHIRDSLLDIKIDTIIAQRRARSAQLADEEAARLARIKAQADERYRRKIDKAKARALKRGKEYKGPE